jgi:KDO2-lipid IV(A) lauroyltransferase
MSDLAENPPVTLKPADPPPAAARETLAAGTMMARPEETAPRKPWPPAARDGRTLDRSPVSQRAVAWLMHFVFDLARVIGRRAASGFASVVLREIGPFVGEHRIGLDNLAAAFPEKAPEERARILAGAWDNLARTTIDYAFLQDLVAEFDPDRPTGTRLEHHGMEHVIGLREGGKPGIVFGAHLGNWELAAAVGRKLGVPITALYRPPANPHVAREIERRRAFVDQLVVSGRGAAFQVAAALQGGRHIGVIIDQRLIGGVELPFFGRPALSNPIVGILARHFECPVHGARAIRLPGGRFRLEFTPAIDLPRDQKGRVDADATNRLVHGMVEGWVREYPEQWLWVHDRWKRYEAAPEA